METINKEKNPSGCSELIPPTPCRCFVWENGKKKYLDVNEDDYKVIGENKDVYFMTLKSVPVL